MEKFWASLLVLPLLVWFSYNSVLDRDFKIRQQSVENIVYQYTQIAAKKGILSDNVYLEMQQRLSRYGVFEISATAEKYYDDASTPLIIANTEVFNRDLRGEGFDIINIYVQCTTEHPLGKLYKITPLGNKLDNSHDIKLFGRAAVFIQ